MDIALNQNGKTGGARIYGPNGCENSIWKYRPGSMEGKRPITSRDVAERSSLLGLHRTAQGFQWVADGNLREAERHASTWILFRSPNAVRESRSESGFGPQHQMFCA